MSKSLTVTFETSDGHKVVRNITPEWNLHTVETQGEIEEFKNSNNISVGDLKSILAKIISSKLDEVFVTGVLDELTDQYEESNRKTYYWSRCPGKWVDKFSGVPVSQEANEFFPKFTGTVREWYEMLVEVIIGATSDAVRDKRRAAGERVKIRAGSSAMSLVECSILYNSETRLISRCHGISVDETVKSNEILLGKFARIVILDIDVI